VRPLVAAGFLLAISGLTLCFRPVVAQDEPPPPPPTSEAADLTIEIVNGTTRQPGQAESILVFSLPPGRPPVAEAANVNGQATLSGVELFRNTPYVVRVTAAGISYFAKKQGWELLQEPRLRIYTFDVTEDLTGVDISGLNVIMRRGEANLQIEYLISIVNNAQPQKSVAPRPTTLEIALPPNSYGVELEFLSGPAPEALPTQSGSAAGWCGLVAALPPGPTRLRLTATMPYPGGAEVPVGANVPIQSWSVLSFPPDLEVRAAGLEAEDHDLRDEFQRQRGPALEPLEILTLDVSGGSSPAVGMASAEAASDTVTATGKPSGNQAGSKTRSWMIWLAILLLAVVLLRGYLQRRS
jgi:hypothetical protein